MIQNPYTAKQARTDYLAKKNQRDNIIDEEKIKRILDSIKEIIKNIIPEETSPYSHIMFSMYLSKGEIELLKSIGYKVEVMEDKFSEGHFKISW